MTGFGALAAAKVVWLDELKEITKNTADDDYLICMPDDTQITDLANMFKEFLQTHDLLLDPSN